MNGNLDDTAGLVRYLDTEVNQLINNGWDLNQLCGQLFETYHRTQQLCNKSFDVIEMSSDPVKIKLGSVKVTCLHKSSANALFAM